MAEIVIRYARATDPHRPIANAADHERTVDVTLLPAVGDWIQFEHGTHRVESRIWNYLDSAPSCLLRIDFLGEVL
jgi:hypothetical protein